MAFLLPHVDSSPGSDQTDSYLNSKIEKIKVIEEVTGIDFLVGLRSMDNGAEKENAIEEFKANSMWPTK